MATMRSPIESGVPDNKQYLHPTMLKNYGNWKYHDRPRPGVLHHVASKKNYKKITIKGNIQ